MLNQQEAQELQKCKESPAYFYNKYIKKPEQPDVTDEYMKMLAKMANNPLKLRRNARYR